MVDDGSDDGTPDRVKAFGDRSPLHLTLLQQGPRGPAAARNRALESARGSACLFIGDDCWPRTDLVARHLRFHLERPALEAALLGRVVWADELRATAFARWLEESGIQFEYHNLPGHAHLPGRFFYTANVSAKTAFLRDAGGFDEVFRSAAGEDVELGTRLERAGMRLAYDEGAVVEHFHPFDLAALLDRMHRVGKATALLSDRVPELPVPRRPGLRHKARASALTALHAIGLRTDALRRATWTFLSHEAAREAYWGDAADDRPLRIGTTLFRLAQRDPLASSGTAPRGR